MFGGLRNEAGILLAGLLVAGLAAAPGLAVIVARNLAPPPLRPAPAPAASDAGSRPRATEAAARGAGTGDKADFCRVAVADVPHPPRFADYPATRTVSRPARPIIAAASRRYRTMIRRFARDGPDFAGDYVIARIGCGTACTNWAIVDSRSGRVFVPPDELQTIVGSGHFEDYRLVYRPDSRLVVVTGAPDGLGELLQPLAEPSGEGFLFLLWTGTTLRPLRFVPLSRLCPAAAPLRERLVLSPYSDRPRIPATRQRTRPLLGEE